MEKYLKFTSKSTAKGFVFTSDALLALIIAFLFISMNSFNPFYQSDNIMTKIEGQRKVNDLFDIMDRKGIFSQLDLTRIEQEMDSAFGTQYEWRITISEFIEENDSFRQTGTYTTGNNSEDLSEKDVIKGNRIFLSFAEKKISKYYVSEYWVWTK
ncbi:MAG: hypothetical protein ABH986_02810 [archaeon]